MTLALTLLPALCALGLLMVALFAGVETLLIRTDRQAVRERAEKGDVAARRAEDIIADAQPVLRMTMAGGLLGLTIALHALMLILIRREGQEPETWISLAAVGAGAFTLLVVITLAKGLAQRMDRSRILSLTWLVTWIRALFHPMEILSRRLVGVFVAWTTSWLPRGETPLSKEQMRQFIREREREGVIEIDEGAMVDRILQLDQTLVREIMRPLVHVVALSNESLTPERIADIARSSGFSRFPIYRSRIIDLIGHIDIYEVLSGGMKSPEQIRALIHPPHFVPETKRVDDLLQEFLRDRRRVAIVIDEHGGCSGWVTREDILEEIFGEISDEFDRDSPPWTEEGQGGAVIEAGADLDDVNEKFGLAIPTTHCDTLGGFIYERLGRVPRVGETVRHGGRILRVQRMNAQQIVSVRLEPGESDAQ